MNMKNLFVVLTIVSLVLLAGCSGNDSENDQTYQYSDEEGEVEVHTTGGGDGDCPVGTVMTVDNPQTGESMKFEVVGTETIDGIEMCKAVYETNATDTEIASGEYLWSEDNNAFIMKMYDSSGKTVYEMTSINGDTTIIDAEGNEMHYNTGSE